MHTLGRDPAVLFTLSSVCLLRLLVSIRLEICSYYVLSITNKMQRNTIFFIGVKALHVSGGFSAYHQLLKNCTHSIGYTASGSSKQARSIPDAVCTVFELLMMGGETA